MEDIVFLFAFIGFSGILFSCARALSVWIDNKYPDPDTEPRILTFLCHALGFFGMFGCFAHPFETYLSNQYYDRMMKRVRAARFLAELRDYPSPSMCEYYNLTPPTDDMRHSLREHIDAESKQEVYCASNNTFFFRAHRCEALDEFTDWRHSEYKKLGL